MNIGNPVPTASIIDSAGRMVNNFRTWTQQISRLSILEGVGSPEGVIEAQVTRQYMDTNGTAGAILYIKRDSDIGGDKTQGWILV